MRYVFFTNTPAHVHLYKHAVRALEGEGHDVTVFARDYGCTLELLDYYEIDYYCYGHCETTKYSLFKELPVHYFNIFRKIRSFDPHLIFGMGGYAAHAGVVAGAPTVLVLDSEPTSIDHVVSKPFVRAIITPKAFQKDLGKKHYTFDGFKETAYLHPDVYEPNPDIREQLGVGDDRYAILRFNAFGSHHDVGHGGFTPANRRELVERLSEHATVFVSDEGGDMDLSSLPAREFDLHPALLHDALAEADLLVADTQTIVTEAALLGTPVIRSNSFVGDEDMGNFLELERAGLVRNIREFDEVLETADELLADPETKSEWRERRETFLADKVNLTDLILEVAQNPSRFESMRSLARPTPAADA